MLECVYEIRRDRSARIVRTTIRVTPWDGVVELIFFAFPRCEIHAGHELWFGFGGTGEDIPLKGRPRGWGSVGRGGAHQILQSATHADMLFAQISIERADVPLGVNVQLD